MWQRESVTASAVENVLADQKTLRTMFDLVIQHVESGERDALQSLKDLSTLFSRMEPNGVKLGEAWEALREVINGMGISEAVTLSGLSRQTIYTLIRNHSVKAEHLPSGQVVIDRESLEHYLRNRRPRKSVAAMIE